MKILYLLVALILTISITSFSQDGMDKMIRQRNKIHQLEKIKLIDELNLDEETSVKFFARRNENRNKIKELMDKSRQQLDAINDKLKEKSVNEKELNSMIDKYLSYDNEIEKEREAFIHSLSDILSVTQIAKLVVFEKKFRDEIRDILFKTRMERRRR